MLDKVLLFYCRIGFAGLSPKAPGTAGSALACLLAPLCYLPLPLAGRVALLAIIFVTGSLAATRVERMLGQKDPGQVVIDELLGVWLTLLPIAEPSCWEIAGAFVFFRIFDITKPGPVKASENWLPDGWGVMLDDAVAAITAMLCLMTCRWVV